MNEQLLATLENSKNSTLDVASAMPADSFDFKPANAGWNFKEQLHHIAYGIQWWEENYVKGIKTEWNQPAAKNSKKEIIAYLNECYASLKKTLRNNELNNDAVNGFHATIDHITHHRGQAIVYLHCKGITPPEYTY